MAKLLPENRTLKDNISFLFRNLESKDAEHFLLFKKQIGKETNNTFHYENMPLPTVEETAKRLELQSDDKYILNIGVFSADRWKSQSKCSFPSTVYRW